MGVWLVPMFTTRNITLLGINHSVSLAPTTVTQTIQTTFQLIYCRLISVCQCIYTIFMQMSESGCVCVYTTEVHYVLILMLLTLLLFYKIPPQPRVARITPPLVCLLKFLRNVPRRCPRSFPPRSLCHGSFPTNADAGCFLCLSGLAGLWITGHLSVWVIFLHPRAEAIWRAPDTAVSVSKSWPPNHELRKSANGVG